MNENENLQPVQKLTPFTKMVMSIGTLPSSFYASMSYYESMVWLYEYLKNNIIPTVNNNAEAVEELQEKFLELKEWTETYTEQTIPTEIENQLNEMVEDGTFTKLISQFAQLTFNNVTEMKTATNLKNGSFVKTYGFFTANDGGSANYKIRNKTNDDVIDEAYIISLHDENLIAELLIENSMNIMCFAGATSVINENDTDYRIWNNALSIAFSKLGGKSTIIIPDGTFYLNDTVQMPFNITIQGVNQETSIFKLVPFSNCDMFNIGITGSKESAKLINLTLHGDFIQDQTNQYTVQSTTGNGIVFLENAMDADGVTIDNCYIENFAENGIKINTNIYVISIKNSQIRFNRYNGIYNHGTDNFFDNLRIYFNGLSGLKNYICGANKFSNMKIYYNCAIDDLTTETNEYNATVKRYNAGLIETACSRNEYINIELQDNYYTGMTLDGVDGILFEGTFDDDGFKGQTAQSLCDELFIRGSTNLSLNVMFGRNNLGYVAHLIETFNVSNSSIVYTRAMESQTGDPNVSGDLIYKTGTSTELLITPSFNQIAGKIFTHSVSLTVPNGSTAATQVVVPLGFSPSGKVLAFVNLYTSYNVDAYVNITGTNAYINCKTQNALPEDTTFNGTLVILSM